MRVIAVSTLRTFWTSFPEAEQPLKAWYHEVRVAAWANPADLKQQFRSASILRGGRSVFNIAGNRFRIVVQIAYNTQIVFIKFVGTHQQYESINAQTIELGGY